MERAPDGLRVWTQAGPPSGWDDLLVADNNSTPAHRPGVAAAFADVFPAHRTEYLLARDASGLAGGMVISVQRMLGAEWLHAMPMLLPGAPVSRGDCREAVDAALAEAFAARAACRSVAGGEWVGYRPGAPLAALHLDRVAGETRRLTASLIDLSGDGIQRWQSDRRERKALRRAERLGLRCAEEPAALDECYALHLVQARRWRGHRPPSLALLRRLVAAPPEGEEPLARLFTVRNPQRLLCGILVLDSPHETFAWWSGTHPHARDAAATRALLVWAVEWAHAHGRARFNLGGSAGLTGVASFKHSLGAQDLDYSVRWLGPARGGLVARAFASLQRRARRGRHRGGAV